VASPRRSKNKFREELAKNNVFSFRKGDAIAYLVFYILIPILVTVISLVNFPSNDIAAAYCYVTILVSALNSIYDAGNRWDNGVKTLKNTKLFVMGLGYTIVAVYAAYVVFYVLIAKTMVRCDWWLITYFLGVIVAMFDFAACFLAEMSFKRLVSL